MRSLHSVMSIDTCCTGLAFLDTLLTFFSHFKSTEWLLDGTESLVNGTVLLGIGDKLSPVTVSNFSAKTQP